MTDVVSNLLKINIRAKSMKDAKALFCGILGAELAHDRGDDTIGEFEGCTVRLGGILFDIVVPSTPDAPLAKVIDKYGEGIDSICFAVEDMDETQARLKSNGIEFSRYTEFHGNKVAFVHPRDANGVAMEFIQGPVVETNN